MCTLLQFLKGEQIYFCLPSSSYAHSSSLLFFMCEHSLCQWPTMWRGPDVMHVYKEGVMFQTVCVSVFYGNPVTSSWLLDSLTPAGIHFLEMEISATAQGRILCLIPKTL